MEVRGERKGAEIQGRKCSISSAPVCFYMSGRTPIGAHQEPLDSELKANDLTAERERIGERGHSCHSSHGAL